ncbi:MAG TPA: DUF4097 family beta strand repeat-containing protein [Longimicrobiaceae bacterium]|nr:DUF4097 family beta strand repeat-containing protein [Longimicrobiaceae bacterium]
MKTTASIVMGALLLAGGVAAQQPINEKWATAPTGEVIIDNMAGSVRVVGWSRNEVQVAGRLGRDARRLEFREEQGATVIRVVMERRARGSEGTRLEVHLPARKGIRIQTLSADVEVEGSRGDVRVQSVSGLVKVSQSRPRTISAASRSGDVQIDAEAEGVTASSTSGSVRVAGAMKRLDASSVSGDVRVSATTPDLRASTVGGTLEVTSLRGRAQLRNVNGPTRVVGRNLSGSFQTVTGILQINGDLSRGEPISLTSHSGDVELRLPAGTSADVQVSTTSGRIRSEIAGARVTPSSPRQQRITLGNGDARVQIRTFSGAVLLRRRT